MAFDVIRRLKNKFSSQDVQLFLTFLNIIIIYAMRSDMTIAILSIAEKKSENPIHMKYNWDSIKKSLLLSSLFLGIPASQLLSWYIANIYSAKKLLCFGVLLAGILHAVIPFIIEVSWIALVFSRVIEGFFQGCVTSCIHVLLAKWISPFERLQYNWLVLSGSKIGIFGALLVSGFLADSNIGWKFIFYLFGSASVIWIIIYYFLGEEYSTEYSNREDVYEIDIKMIPWKRILSSKAVWSLILVSCGQKWSFYVLLMELPTYMQNILQFNIHQIGIFLAMSYLLTWIFELFIWQLVNIAQNKFKKSVIRKMNNTIAMCGPAIVMITLVLVEPTNQIIGMVILVIMIMFNAGISHSHQTNHLDLNQNFTEVIISIVNSISYIFSFLGIIICELIVTDLVNVKQWNVVFYLTASINIATNFIFVLFGEVENQFWSRCDRSLSRYRDQSCRVSTITAAYSLQDINRRITEMTEDAVHL